MSYERWIVNYSIGYLRITSPSQSQSSFLLVSSSFSNLEHRKLVHLSPQSWSFGSPSLLSLVSTTSDWLQPSFKRSTLTKDSRTWLTMAHKVSFNLVQVCQFTCHISYDIHLISSILVFLSVTGLEALYADLGHFGTGPVRVSFIFVVLPAIVLNYLGQGALLITDPSAVDNPFYNCVSGSLIWPLVIISTLATIIASQGMIFQLYHDFLNDWIWIDDWFSFDYWVLFID